MIKQYKKGIKIIELDYIFNNTKESQKRIIILYNKNILELYIIIEEYN